MSPDLVALVTGGASGIGLATVQRLSALAVTVVSLDLQPTAVKGVHSAIADVTDQGAIDRAVSQLGRVDIVVNSAGIGAVGTVVDNPDDEWHHLYDVNVVGIARMMRATWSRLRESDHAAVVNVASIAGTAGLPQRACYSATKGAVVALTLAMAADGIADSVRVNAVAPGTADTPWVARLLAAAPDPDAARAALEARQPIGRLVRAEEVAAMIVTLASPDSSSITGTIIPIDGGMAGLRLPPR